MQMVRVIRQHFNPRTREGCDGSQAETTINDLFQSTHPRRVRPFRRTYYHYLQNFNPRTREGCDDSQLNVYENHIISIHAPAKGATKLFWKIFPKNKISIHAPAKGATVLSNGIDNISKISIHAPAKGATKLVFMMLFYIQFQSTHPRRVRPWSIPNKYPRRGFQSTHPRRVRLVWLTIRSPK